MAVSTLSLRIKERDPSGVIDAPKIKAVVCGGKVTRAGCSNNGTTNRHGGTRMSQMGIGLD